MGWLDGDGGARGHPLAADVVAAGTDVVGRDGYHLAGDGERHGDGPGGGGGGGGKDDAGPPSAAVERLDDVVETEAGTGLRRERRGPRPNVGGGDGLRAGGAAGVGGEVGEGDGVEAGVLAAARGGGAEHGGLEPRAVETGVVDADLDLGAGQRRRQGRRRRRRRRRLHSGRSWGSGGGPGAFLFARGAAALAGARRRVAAGHRQRGVFWAAAPRRAQYESQSLGGFEA